MAVMVVRHALWRAETDPPAGGRVGVGLYDPRRNIHPSQGGSSLRSCGAPRHRWRSSGASWTRRWRASTGAASSLKT